MPLELFHTDEYKDLIKEHLFNTIAFLLESGMEFSLAADIRHVSFQPELPRDISSSFEDVVLFVMAGYTFESSQLEDEIFLFEAGFGAEGFGSTVTVPLLAIKQIFVNDFPIAINISEPKRVRPTPNPNKSMEALLNNPENKKLLKKSKK